MEKFNDLLMEQQSKIRDMSRVLPNLKKLGQDNITLLVIDRRMTKVKELLQSITKRDVGLRNLATDELHKTCSYFSEQQLDACKDEAEAIMDQLDIRRASIHPEYPSSTGMYQDQPRSGKPIIPLPTIDFPKFNGSPEQWTAFRSRFTALISSDKRITDYERMHYLCSALSGEANEIIKSLDITAESFSIAWNALEDRYDNERLIVTEHVRVLFNIPVTKPDNPKSLRSLRDTVHNTVQALKKRNRAVDTWDDLLVYLITSKLDAASRADLESVLRHSRQCTTYAEIDQFLQSRSNMLESLSRPSPIVADAASVRTTKTPKVTALSTLTERTNCIVCQQRHPLFQCLKFQSFDASRRRKIVTDAKRCLNCFRSGHPAAACYSHHRCRACQDRHHTLLHIRTDASAAKTQIAGVSSMPATENRATSLAAFSAFTINSVLLATARVRIYSPHNRNICVRALIDQGSEITVISENIAQLLRLPRRNFELSIHGLGNCQTSSRHATDIRFGPVFDDRIQYPTSAVILPSLSSYTTRRGQWNSEWKHLRNLRFADDDPFSADPIDMVIGSNLFGAVFRKGFRSGRPDQPIAQQTIFGWIVSGSLSQSPPSGVSHVHHAVLERLSVDLSRFWEI